MVAAATQRAAAPSAGSEVILAVKDFAGPFTIRMATTDIWESADAQAAWYGLEPKEQRQQRVRNVLVPVEV